MKKGVVIAIGAAVVLAVVLWSSKAKAAAKPKPKPVPDTPPEPTPDPEPGPVDDEVYPVTPGTIDFDFDFPDPQNPKPVPTQGLYYRVKKNDTLTGIARAAGLTARQWHAIRDFKDNDWLKRTKDGNGETVILLTQSYARPGYRTQWMARTSVDYAWPVIFVPNAADAAMLGW
jgi:LysM repeat protein